MAKLATCPCGEKFLVMGTFPRKLACHRCGARTIVYNATEIDVGQGWRLGEEEIIQQGRCFDCDSPCSTACARCGWFFCRHHGRVQWFGGSTCVDCYVRLRPGFLIAGAMFILCGMICVLGAVVAPEPNEPKLPYYLSFLPIAAGCVVAGIVQLWYGWRTYG